MEILKNKTLLIGKEPIQGRLLISINLNGKDVTATIGSTDSVPGSVSRCIPAENKAHCTIDINGKGTMILTNLKPQNITCVNGTEIMSKKITKDSVVTLGRDNYRVDIGKVLEVANKLAVSAVGSGVVDNAVNNNAGAVSGNGVSIKHLEKVWNKYYTDTLELKKEQKRLGLIKGLYMPITLLGSLAATAAQFIFDSPSVKVPITVFFSIVAAIVLFYGLRKQITDKSLEKTERLNDAFQDDYVCPKCQHFMGNQAYKLISRNNCCPYCKTKYTEK